MTETEPFERAVATYTTQITPTAQLLAAVTRAAGLVYHDADPNELFRSLLDDLLTLSGSEYGYIGEVLFDDAGAPYLQTRAITDISWDQDTRNLYEEHVVRGEGLLFRNLDTLFGWGLLEGGRVVIANDLANDPRSSGRPGGHPPLDAYLVQTGIEPPYSRLSRPCPQRPDEQPSAAWAPPARGHHCRAWRCRR